MRVLGAGVAVAMALLCASPASAAETFVLSGQITGFSDPANLLGGASFVGTPFSTTVTFDPAQPSHTFGTDLIGTIDAGALKILSPADAAMQMRLSGGAIFLGILPGNPISFTASGTDVRCGGSGGVTLRPGGTASFGFSCGFFGGPTISAQGDGTYSSAPAAVPEPATWATMILGFGAIGYSMRRRNKVAARIQLA